MTPTRDVGSTAGRGIRIVVLVMLAAAVLRAPRLAESFWYDEIAAWKDYGSRGPATIVSSFHDPANHIAHTLLTWVSVELLRLDAVLGPEPALRVPALLFSLLSIAAIFALVRTVAPQRTAAAATVLAAVLPVAVLEGVEARGYSMMICCAAGATWAFIEAERSSRCTLRVAYILFCVIGIWAHLMTVFVPVGHAAWIAWRLARRRGPMRDQLAAIVMLGTAALVTLALYAVVLDDIIRIRGTLTVSTERQPTLFGVEGLHALLQLGGSWFWWAALPGGVLGLVGLGSGLREPAQREAIALSLLGLPIMGVAVLVADVWVYARFALFALPGMILLMALGVGWLWERHRALGPAALAVVAVCALADLWLRPAKQPLREAMRLVIEQSQPGEPVVAVGLRHKVLDVYAGGLDVRYSLRHGEDLAAVLDASGADRVVVYYPLSVPEDRYELLRARGFREARRFRGWVDWGNGDVIVFRRD